VKKIDLLRDLQSLDSALDQVRQDLEQGRVRLGDDSELVPLREELETVRKQLKGIKSKGRDLDDEIETRTIKRQADEKKLYGGTVKNPKDLGSLAHEVDMEKQQISKLEDQSLVNMESLEAASSAEAAAKDQLDARDREWQSEQASLESRCAELASQETDFTTRRQQIASQLDEVTIKNYDRTRRMRGGVAVVPIQRGACQGCRVSLSSIVVQRARSSSDLVTCQSCGRILYLP
jgi:predicted  nucleic acid-binding Zn-ribbon protein